MKYRIWIAILLAACLLTGCSPAAPAESSAETQSSSTPETTAPVTAGSTVPGGDCDFVYQELTRIPVEAEAEIFEFPPAGELRDYVYSNDGWPTYPIQSLQELEAFWEENRYPTEGYITDAPSYQEAVGEYDDRFFETKSLVVVFIYSGSGSYRYGLEGIYKESGGSLYVEVDFLNDTDVGTANMKGWLLVCALDKEDLEGVTDYHSYTVNWPLEEFPVQQTAQEKTKLPLNSTLCVFQPHNTELIRWGGLNNPTEYPTYRVDSLQELEDFWNTYGMPGQKDATWQEVGSFQAAVAGYDDAYFAENSLILTYIRLGTHQQRYQLHSLHILEDNFLGVSLVMTEGDVGSDEEIAHWMLVTEVEKEAIQNVTSYASGEVQLLEVEAVTVHVGDGSLENPDFYTGSRSQWKNMPLHRIESLQQLEIFQLRYAEDFDFGSHSGWGLCFVEAAQAYDEAFFEENELLILYYTTPEGVQFALEEVTIAGRSVGIQLLEEAGGEAGGWFMLLPFPKESVKDPRFSTLLYRYTE